MPDHDTAMMVLYWLHMNVRADMCEYTCGYTRAVTAAAAAGAPNKSGKDMRGGIKERLQRAGFTGVRWVDACQGFVAMKA